MLNRDCLFAFVVEDSADDLDVLVRLKKRLEQ
jgi:hypothetical protein